ncbi:MAG: D-tyrosyl-tRNA(Tyr) deacylase [Acidaminococcales bacterium]|jgi:D-tyrosyl-tRNA(Tyr) deacylase|nr:D-tyrosyl-tRNA(Tyr) deacylase [Acidaminococcales bacterium]
MRAVVQRVAEAWVDVAGVRAARIDRGLAALLGVEKQDSEKDAIYLAEKIINLRIFDDGGGKMNLSLKDIKGGLLAVPQFTLLADCRKGRRPGFDAAAPPEEAGRLFEKFVAVCAEAVSVQTGRFREEMFVGLVNHGPVTILLDSRKTF